jgi:hypothetical protein
MANASPEDVTLNTLHEDLKGGFTDVKSAIADLKGEVRTGFTDLKATMVAGFRSMPTREDSQEMIRLLRERIRILTSRPPELGALDARIREQGLELQQALDALAEETQGFKDPGDAATNA